MSENDYIVINVKPSVECPMCCERKTQENMEITCPKKNSDHNVCKDCLEKLRENGYEDGCVYCGYRSEKNENLIIARAPDVSPEMNNIVVIESPPRIFMLLLDRNFENAFGIVCAIIVLLLTSFLVYIVGIGIFTFGQMFHHILTEQNHHHAIEWTLRNCFLGYLCFAIFIYIFFQIYIILAVIHSILIPPTDNR